MVSKSRNESKGLQKEPKKMAKGEKYEKYIFETARGPDAACFVFAITSSE